MVKKGSKQWTKDDISKVLKLWNSKTGEEICDELRIAPAQLYYIAKQIRVVSPKALPKKHRVGILHNLIRDALGK